MKNVRIGTCSWADKTMVKTWYPPGVSTAEARLRYYAAHFDTVEVDSPFYAIPSPEVSVLWAQRTPPGFTFHIKAYGMMTGHAVDVRTLPPELSGRSQIGDVRGRISNPGPQMLSAAFRIFSESLAPLRAAGKLGGVLLQFPARFAALDAEQLRQNLRYLDYCRSELQGDRLLVEFRHPSWVSPGHLHEVTEFLSERDMSFVSVDAPQFSDNSTMPPLALATTSLAYVRLHGRNTETYFARNPTAADRFDYLYAPEELREWEPRVRALAAESETTYVMFNNCRYDFAPRNASELAEILVDIAEPTIVKNFGAADADSGQSALF